MSHYRRSVAGLSLAVGFALLTVQGAGSVRAVAAPRDAVQVAQNDPDQSDDPSSAAALLVRVDRLENKIRSMTGQIEQLQFQNKHLDDALRKMQQDVDFRFQDLSRAPGGKPPLQKRGDLGDAAPETLADAAPDATSASPVEVDPATPSPARPQKRGDAFDPATEPNAVGAPKPLGTTAPSAPLPLRSSIAGAGAVTPPPVRTVAPAGVDALHAPLDLTHGALAAAAATTAVPDARTAAPDYAVVPVDPASRSVTASREPASDTGTLPIPQPAAPAPNGSAISMPAPGGSAAPGVASLTPGGTRNEYETDFGLYKNGQFDAAAAGLQDFVQKYPRDRLVPDATYFLGESYARLGRHREAAEQFLKLSTDYTKSSRAPDALLRLGVALNALGAKEQACATYQEVDRKYPTASPDVRAGVERELKRSRC